VGDFDLARPRGDRLTRGGFGSGTTFPPGCSLAFRIVRSPVRSSSMVASSLRKRETIVRRSPMKRFWVETSCRSKSTFVALERKAIFWDVKNSLMRDARCCWHVRPKIFAGSSE
jgi:hypothetical protein